MTLGTVSVGSRVSQVFDRCMRIIRMRPLLRLPLVAALHCAFLALLPVDSIAASDGVRITGPGTPPQLDFACCEQSVAQSQTFLADPAVIALLRALHSRLAVAIVDFSPQRTALIRHLNQAGIPVVAWILLPKDQGYYLNADTAPHAVARIAAFEQWTRDNHLEWSAVGLDIEPDFTLLAALKAHPGQLIATLLDRCFDTARMNRAGATYSTLIAQLQAHGYVVQTYQMPYLPAERRAHSTLPDRLLGTIDVRGNEEYLMLYTSAARPIGAAMIWSLGPHAQFIAIGSTDGAGTPGPPAGPLDWNEFSRDLIVAGHFSRRIGIYDLEGCIRQGFLPRLQSFNWSQSVELSSTSIRRAQRISILLPTVLFVLSYSPWFLLALVVLIAFLLWRRHNRKAMPC